MIKKIIFLICILVQGLPGPGQSNIINSQARLFKIPLANDTIEFIKVDTSTAEKKPVLLFCQGSLPIPLFVDFGEKGMYMLGGGMSNFDYKSISKKYHIVVISMPKTPVVAGPDNLNTSYQYVPNKKEEPHKFADDYIRSNYFQNYIDRGNKVIGFLLKQKWVDKSKLIIAGHSQGSKIAVKLALQNKEVTHLGLFSANPFGRIDQMIRQQRKDAMSGKISWIEAEKNIEYWENIWKDVHNPDSVAVHPEYRAWKTFSEPLYDDWLKLDIPVYVTYGTNDIVSDLCDIVPLLFIEKGKNNLTLKRQHGYDHNFFDDERNLHWKEVMNEFMDWVGKN